MSTHFRLAVAAGSALLLAAGLAGCAGFPNDTGAGPPSAGTASDASVDIPLDPLSEYLATDLAEIDGEDQQIEEFTQKCMKKRGFDYTAWVVPTVAEDLGVAPIPIKRSREWVAENGFSVVDTEFSQAGYVSNPNQAHTDSLSRAERTRYEKALNQCMGKAAKAIAAKRTTKSPPIIDDATLFARGLAEHPKVLAIYKEVSSCLADVGISADPANDIRAKAVAYLEANPSATTENADVVAMKKEEVRVALALWDCREDVDFFDRIVATFTALEKDYVTEHKPALEEARRWLDG